MQIKIILLSLLLFTKVFSYHANSLWVIPLSSDRLHNIGMSDAIQIHDYLIEELRNSGNWEMVVEPAINANRFLGYDSLGFPYNEADQKRVDLCLITSIRHTNINYFGSYDVYSVFNRLRIVSGIIQAPTIEELKKRIAGKIKYQFPPILPVEGVDSIRGTIRLRFQPGMNIDQNGTLTLFSLSKNDPNVKLKAISLYQYSAENGRYYVPAGQPKILSIENNWIYADLHQAGSFDPENSCVVYKEPHYRIKNNHLTIAVMDLDCQIEGLKTNVVSDLLRNVLFERIGNNLLERSAMNEILHEQGFQQSGACDERTCVVEAGQLLGTDRMIFGSIGTLGDAILLNLRLVNVATGQIENNVIITEKISIDKIPTMFQRVVNKLFLQYENEEAKVGLGDILDANYIIYNKNGVVLDDEEVGFERAFKELNGKLDAVPECRTDVMNYMLNFDNIKNNPGAIADAYAGLAKYNIYLLPKMLEKVQLAANDSIALSRYMKYSIHYYGDDDFRQGIQQNHLRIKEVIQILAEIPDVNHELTNAAAGYASGNSGLSFGGRLMGIGALSALTGVALINSNDAVAAGMIFPGGLLFLIGGAISLGSKASISESAFYFQKALYIYNRRLLGYLE